MKPTFEKWTNRLKIKDEAHKDRPRAILRDRLKISTLILAVYFILNLLHAGCPIKFTTGISCPGCGMTRAVLSALHLRFRDAFYYHPLFLLSPLMFLLFLFEAYFNPKHVKIAWTIIIALFLIVYVIRLFFTHNSVVEIDIKDGIVLKLIYQIYVGGLYD